MKKRILLVEYASATVEVIKEILAHPLFELTVVTEGDAAKKTLTEKSFDLLITAAMLPKFHGFNLSQHTAENFPGTRIIIISEIYKGMDYKHQAVTQYRADDFFEKPFDKKAFRLRIYELLGIRQEDLDTAAGTESEASQSPAHDTKKLPTLQSLEQEGKEGSKVETKQMTSEDLFGDIIQEVQKSGAEYEINLNDEDSTGPKPPKVAPVTQEMPKVKPAAKPKKPALDEDTLTRVLTVDSDVVSQETKPEEIMSFIDDDEKVETKEVPFVTREMKAPPRDKPATQATRKIDLDLLNLIKADEKKKEKKSFKKIEDDISKKFEETLTGLGLGLNEKRSRPAPTSKPAAPPPPKVDTPPPPVVDPKTQLMPKVEKEDIDQNDDVGGFEILGQIARGGMAEIYKAKKRGVKGFEKLVAIKKILSGYGGDEKFIEMFVDEAKIAAQLTHPNIVQIYDLGKQEDYYFIAMEYVAGKDLRQILGRLAKTNTSMPEYLSIFLIIRILEALGYAHKAKDSYGNALDIVHRDVSPPNIMVSYNGNIKLTDFGVSKAANKMHHTVAGALKGKLLYMSPEQARGDENIDYRSDLYSAGIILFELLTGEKLFLGSSEIGTLKKVQDGKVIRPSQLKQGITPSLDAIVLKALDKDVNKRYQKASHMIKDLEEYMRFSYDNLPETTHMAHFIYTLFKEEITAENIGISLKPLPFAIKRKMVPKPATVIPPEPISLPDDDEPFPLDEPLAEETSQPEPSVESDPDIRFEDLPPEEEIKIDVSQFEDAQPVEPSKPEPQPEPQLDTEPEPEPVEEEDFQPVIEINFDEEPAKQETSGTTPESVLAEFEASEQAGGKKKTLLFIAVAVVIILAAVIVYILMTGNASGPEQPVSEPPARSGAAVPAATQPQPAADQSGTETTDQEAEPAEDQAAKKTESGNASDTVSAQPPAGTLDSSAKPGKETAVPAKTIQPSPKPQPATAQPEAAAPKKTVNEPPVKEQPIQEKTTTPAKAKPEEKPKEQPKTQPKTLSKEQPKEQSTTETSEQGKEPPLKQAEKQAQQPPEKAAAETDTGSEQKTQAAQAETPPPKKEPVKVETSQPPQPAAPVVKEGDLIGLAEVDTPPKPISTPLEITRGIKRLLLSNQRILVSFLVNHKGEVETVKLIQKSRMKKLNTLIEETVKKWKYKPAIKDNVKVKVWKNKWIAINK